MFSGDLVLFRNFVVGMTNLKSAVKRFCAATILEEKTTRDSIVLPKSSHWGPFPFGSFLPRRARRALRKAEWNEKGRIFFFAGIHMVLPVATGGQPGRPSEPPTAGRNPGGNESEGIGERGVQKRWVPGITVDRETPALVPLGRRRFLDLGQFIFFPFPFFRM